MRFKLMSMLAAVALLGACASEPQSTGTAGGAAGGAPQAQAPATQSGPRPGSQEDLVKNVGDRIFYDFDKSELRPEARRTIERWAAWLKQYPQNTVTVEGHCDERGTREYNIALGERRATAARNFLVSQGIDARRVATISYGKERPAVLGSNEAAWSQNRRSVMQVN
ncbi:MAG: peptidoglycan-associated lipoprotein Pal [Alphaproteobacteria bacterium]|nr:peptidoglycan-associated lipoprotein Pal [Alphaproteobacteria bacterium]